MLTLPIPAFAARVLGTLGLHAWQRGEAPIPLLVLIGALAVQSSVVAGHQHYSLPGFAMLQLVLALCLPPLAWAAFEATVRRPLARGDLWHVRIPALGPLPGPLHPAGCWTCGSSRFLFSMAERSYGLCAGRLILRMRGWVPASARCGFDDGSGWR